MGTHPFEGYFIRVPLEPFQFFGDTVSTSVRLDRVSLPTSDLAKLSGQTQTFPLNPEDGYIDGSIYVGNGHHPLDVQQITFGKADKKSINAVIDCAIDFEFEGLEDFEKTAWKFEVILGWTDEPQNA